MKARNIGALATAGLLALGLCACGAQAQGTQTTGGDQGAATESAEQGSGAADQNAVVSLGSGVTVEAVEGWQAGGRESDQVTLVGENGKTVEVEVDADSDETAEKAISEVANEIRTKPAIAQVRHGGLDWYLVEKEPDGDYAMAADLPGGGVIEIQGTGGSYNSDLALIDAVHIQD